MTEKQLVPGSGGFAVGRTIKRHGKRYGHKSKFFNTVKWTKLIVRVEGTTMDPGIRNVDVTTTEIARQELKEGEPVPYRDRSGVVARLTLVGMDDKGVTVQVGKSEYRINAGHECVVDTGGRDYTNFELIVALD